jgi:hypothetical protein
VHEPAGELEEFKNSSLILLEIGSKDVAVQARSEPAGLRFTCSRVHDFEVGGGDDEVVLAMDEKYRTAGKVSYGCSPVDLLQ